VRQTLIRLIDFAWLTFGVIWLIASFRTKSTAQVQSVGSRVVQSLLTVAAYFLLFSGAAPGGFLADRLLPASVEWALIGTALVLVGLLFALWARFFLGANWSARVTVKHDHELIQSGPYRLVRHPIYSGLLLAILGAALAFGEARCLLAVVLAFIGLKLKSLTEEKFMLGQFGESYAQYRREVKGLIPFIW